MSGPKFRLTRWAVCIVPLTVRLNSGFSFLLAQVCGSYNDAAAFVVASIYCGSVIKMYVLDFQTC